MSKNKRVPAISADGVVLKKGMGVVEVYTYNGGKDWLTRAVVVCHTNHEGMVCFESPPKLWHTQWGDNLIFAHDANAVKECCRRRKIRRLSKLIYRAPV